jgi:hypothetical protein
LGQKQYTSAAVRYWAAVRAEVFQIPQQHEALSLPASVATQQLKLDISNNIMKLWTQLLILTILDFIIICFWVGEPDPSVSIGIIIVVPFVIIINLTLAGLFYAFKRQYSKAFLMNSIISAIIMYNLFMAGIGRHQRMRYEGWNFIIKDTIFKITHSKLDSTFSITYSTNPGSSSSFIEGQFIDKNNFYLLTTDTTKFIIKDNFIFGFQNNDSIKLTKIDY